jgi:hypothetical protein
MVFLVTNFTRLVCLDSTSWYMSLQLKYASYIFERVYLSWARDDGSDVTLTERSCASSTTGRL